MSTNQTNPQNLFGGTWTQIKDRFLLACGDSYSNGETGGNATHTHSQGSTGKANGNTGAASGSTGSTILTIDQMPNHNHIQTSGSSIAVTGAGSYHDNTKVDGEYNATPSKFNTYRQITLNTGGGQGHTHTLNSHTHTLNEHTHTNPNTNSASSMPPYLAVYVWKRIA